MHNFHKDSLGDNEFDDDVFVDDDDDIEIVSLLGNDGGSLSVAWRQETRDSGSETTKISNRRSIYLLAGVLVVCIFVVVFNSKSFPGLTKNNSVETDEQISSHSFGTEKEASQYDATSNATVCHGCFQLYTGNERVDKAYRLAMDELHQNIARTDSAGNPISPYFIAGAGWNQMWTRDISYAVELAGGLIQPEVSRYSLSSCTEDVLFKNSKGKHTVWYQDRCGHFGGWPNLTDAIVGARGAWHLYLYTGNSTFLEWAFETTINSLQRAEEQALLTTNGDTEHFLFGGCSSFMESNSGYPKKYEENGALVGKTKALSTNILYYNAYYYAYRMGTILMESTKVVSELKIRARKLKQTIRDRLWSESRGLYAYFEDEDGALVPQTEALGIALAMLSDEFESDHRAKMILKSIFRTEVGVPSLWPRFDLGNYPNNTDDHISRRYHNGRIWPFVSAYFAIAAARYGRVDIFAEEMAHLIDLSEQDSTFAEFYELDKSFPSTRRRQLWSDTGYLGMIYKGLFGMIFQPDSIEFSPCKDDGQKTGLEINETISLLNMNYRKAVLDIHISGYGNHIISFKLNGIVQAVPKVSAYVTGRQLIEIEVTQSESASGPRRMATTQFPVR